MPTIVLRVDAAQPDPELLAQAAAVLRRGGLVAFPTETVYGLGANALDAAAVERIFAAKRRPASDPLIVHIAAPEQLALVAQNIPPLAQALAHAFWPGPLTLVLERRAEVPAIVASGGATVAVRMPSHAVALALIAAARLPVAAPSANLFTRPSPTLAAHVLEDLGGRIDMLLDGGATTIGLESTVVDLTQDPPALLRPGGLPFETLKQHIPTLSYTPRYAAEDPAQPLAAPGMLLKHYSPRAELLLFAGAPSHAIERMQAEARAASGQGRRVGIMAPDEEYDSFAQLGAPISALGPRDQLDQIGQRIFSCMRELDQQGVDLILVRSFGQTGLGLAIWDRLLRAAEGRVIDAGDAL